jgi:regulator of sigma E protease
VIFIHELGHFLAAKWCDVHVEQFAVGFGNAIVAWRQGIGLRSGSTWAEFETRIRKHLMLEASDQPLAPPQIARAAKELGIGETEYRLNWIPLGGYVKMVGEDPREASDAEVTADPRSFPNKKVGARMLIISAGVIMNVILGMVLFVYVYLNGRELVAPRVAMVEPGSPADRAGLVAGSELLEVGDSSNPSFEDVFYSSALAIPDDTKIHMKWKTPTGEVREGEVTPRKLPEEPKPVIGVAMPFGLQLMRNVEEGKSPAKPGSVAAAAEFRPGDKLTGIRLKGEKSFEPLAHGPDLNRKAYSFRGEPVEFEVVRKGETETVAVQPAYFHSFGFHVRMGPILSLNPDAKSTLPSDAKNALKVDDVLLEIDGKAIGTEIDPLRLPDMLSERGGENVELKVKRGSETLTVPVRPLKDRGSWNEFTPGPTGTLGIPALGLAYKVEPTLVHVQKNSPAAEAGLKPGDQLKSLKFLPVEESQEKPYDLTKYSWPWLFMHVQHIDTRRRVEFKVLQDDQEKTVTMEAVPVKDWPLPDYGFFQELETTTHRADSVWDAVALGFRDTHRMIGRVYLNLRGLIRGDISIELLSGPIKIPKAAYDMADRSFTSLVLFLAMISINLAVVNFLPIPVLDGGHMVFLIIEKIRGKPTDDRAMIAANVVGLVILGSLMILVVTMDLRSMFFKN